MRMFSTDVAVREEQPCQAPTKQLFAGVPVQESKKLAGKVVIWLQLYQDALKLVPLETPIKGKLVRPVQPNQALVKLVPLEALIAGKLVRPVQSCQVLAKLVPLETSIKGKLVSCLQLNQA